MMTEHSRMDYARLGWRSKGVGFLVMALVVFALQVIHVGVDSAIAQENTGATDSQDEASSSEESSKNKKKNLPKNPFPNRTEAPSLDGGTGWLNTAGEITLKDLRGKVVLLDFWTYCCINCIHVLPDLEYLEEKYAEELVVIGVHSAKFDNEEVSENIRQAILRYEIKHPVINDAEMALWRKFGARSWPTLVLIDPEGFYCGYISGEGHRSLLDTLIGKLVTYHEAKGTLDRTPVRFDLEREDVEPTPLKFPGKVLAENDGNRLFIADTNHNRIVVCTRDGKLLEVIGSGAMGAGNGSYGEASFDHPQGMALVEETLYVADTENHLIRRVELDEKRVSILAGTGQQARRRSSGGHRRSTALNSPWDLAAIEDTLYIAMAGPHQLWSHQLGSRAVQVFAGTGQEDIRDGSLRQSAFAQPSGFATDGRFLYVADSEGSAIRKVSLASDGKARTLAGPSGLPRGRALFEFGDVDGTGGKARFQHPLGLAYKDGTLYVADSYNHKIKKIDTDSHQVETWLGTGKPGNSLDPPQFSEPGGLSIAGETLYVADTNNHRILRISLKSGKAEELTIDGLEPARQPEPDNQLAESTQPVEVASQTVTAGDGLGFQIELTLPDGYKLNPRGPVTYRLQEVGDKAALIAPESLEKRKKAATSGESSVTFQVPLQKPTGRTMLELALAYTYCRGGQGGLCKLQTHKWRIPVVVRADAEQKAVHLKASATK